MGSQTGQALKAARRFVRAVQQSGIDLDVAYLFGSYAHGTPHEWSDIDVALVSKDLTGGVGDLEKIRAALHIAAEIRRAHNRRFTASELKAIKQFGDMLLTLRPTSKGPPNAST